jgi:hypothetical protein
MAKFVINKQHSNISSDDFLIYLMTLSQLHEMYIGKQLCVMIEVILKKNQFLDLRQLINLQARKSGTNQNSRQVKWLLCA